MSRSVLVVPSVMEAILTTLFHWVIRVPAGDVSKLFVMTTPAVVTPTALAYAIAPLGRFVADHALEIANARPMMPSGLNDREADLWEPLIVIGDLAGGRWRELARQAAVGLTESAREHNPIGSLPGPFAHGVSQTQIESLFFCCNIRNFGAPALLVFGASRFHLACLGVLSGEDRLTGPRDNPEDAARVISAD